MDFARELLGIGVEPKDLNLLHACARAFVIFLVTIVLVRLAHKRFLSRMTAFDTVLGFLLASLLARAINGSGPLGPTICAALLLVLLHRTLSAATFFWASVGGLLKGQPDVLVENGKPDPEKLRRHRISEHDLLEEARLNGRVSELSQVHRAVLERNGEISILPKQN